MSERVKALERIDELTPSELWTDIERRSPGPEPQPPVPRSRRLVVAAVAFAIAIAGIGIPIVVITRAHDTPVGTPSGTATQTPSGTSSSAPPVRSSVERLGITLEYPSEWYEGLVSQPATLDPNADEGEQFGVVLSNAPEAMPSVDPLAASPGPLPNGPNLPSDFVTVTVLAVEPELPIRPYVPDTPLPLSMSDAKVVPGDDNIRILRAWVAGRGMTITVQGGPEASASDLALGDAIVASIRPMSSAPPTVEPLRLDPLALTASLDDPPADWTEVTLLPVGNAEGELGVQPCSECGEQLAPSAMAVDLDGSLWVTDSYKARIAHFARDGAFLEAFPAKIGSAIPDATGSADLAFVGERLYVLLEEGGSKIAPVGPGGLGDPITVNDEGKALHVQALIPGQNQLLVMISGAERLLGGYWAFATVDPATGQVTPSPGVQSPTGSYGDLQPVLDTSPGDDWEVRWYGADRGLVAIQEVRFQLAQGGKELGTSVGDAYVRTATHEGVATVMSIGDGQGMPVGAWYLEITPDGGAVFERLPDGGFIGDVRRYLTMGPEGQVYRMRLLDDGLHVYRR